MELCLMAPKFRRISDYHSVPDHFIVTTINKTYLFFLPFPYYGICQHPVCLAWFGLTLSDGAPCSCPPSSFLAHGSARGSADCAMRWPWRISQHALFCPCHFISGGTVETRVHVICTENHNALASFMGSISVVHSSASDLLGLLCPYEACYLERHVSLCPCL